jgi:hypothetical protein
MLSFESYSSFRHLRRAFSMSFDIPGPAKLMAVRKKKIKAIGLSENPSQL